MAFALLLSLCCGDLHGRSEQQRVAEVCVLRGRCTDRSKHSLVLPSSFLPYGKVDLPINDLCVISKLHRSQVNIYECVRGTNGAMFWMCVSNGHEFDYDFVE
jgi:hypothetical protein